MHFAQPLQKQQPVKQSISKLHHHDQHQLQEQQQQQQRKYKQHYYQHHNQYHLMVTLLIALILLQHVELFVCRHLNLANKRTRSSSSSSASQFNNNENEISSVPVADSDVDDTAAINDDDDDAIAIHNKRGNNVVGSIATAGQPEEIFYASDQLETNYDEYPMIVPKRAALLLDRLMVALHHALEKERRRLNDFYASKHDILTDATNLAAIKEKQNEQQAQQQQQQQQHHDFEQGNANNMYSDDDPSVIMDYDFKDLNSINRATGETFMEKSFQRRANMGLHLDDDFSSAQGMAMLTAANDETSGGGGGGGGVHKAIGAGGRMYWRCYFNAVSCF